MLMYARALGCLLMVICMLYAVLLMLLGPKRRVAAGTIAFAVLGLTLMAAVIGLMKADLSQPFSDEAAVYKALYQGFLQQADRFIDAWAHKDMPLRSLLTLIGMTLVLLANTWILVSAGPQLMKERFSLRYVVDFEDFFAECFNLFPVITICYSIAFAVLTGVNMLLCIGAYWLLHGVWPW